MDNNNKYIVMLILSTIFIFVTILLRTLNIFSYEDCFIILPPFLGMYGIAFIKLYQENNKMQIIIQLIIIIFNIFG